jgi:hypothetical protein
MKFEHLIDHRSHHDGGDHDIAEEHHGLPPVLHAHVLALGPGHAPALSELLIAHPRFATPILQVASPRVGLNTVQRAIATANQNPGAGAEAPLANAPPAATAEAVVASTPETSPAPSPVQAPDAGSTTALEPSQQAGPSTRVVAAARAYNEMHPNYAAGFNAATSRACVGTDGQLDPVAVWHWQMAHGIRHDGCVGPQTMESAKLESKDQTSQTETATAPPPPAPEQRVATPQAEAPPQPAPEPVVEAVAEAAPQPTVEVAAQPAVEAAPKPAPKPTVEAQASAARTEPGPQTGTANQAEAAGGQPEAAPTPAPVVPVRPDNGGPGSLARRTLHASGTADAAFVFLMSEDDAVLDKNLADYGNVDEQRSLLDGVITAGVDTARVKRAFHAYWHVEVSGVPEAGNAAATWPVDVLKAIHHQLRLIPDRDARNGAWKQLALKGGGGRGNRGFWGSGQFSIVGDGSTWTKDTWTEGYGVHLTAPASQGDPALHVTEGGRFKVGETLALDSAKPDAEVVTVTGIAGDTYTLASPVQHHHDAKALLAPNDRTAERQVSWLDYTVRHEMAHALDGGAVNGKGFYALGGWRQDSALQLDEWGKAMGGDAAWTGADGVMVNENDRIEVKLAVEGVVGARGRTLFDKPGPLMAYKNKRIPVIDAVETSLHLGGTFYNSPTSIYASHGKRFSVNFDFGVLQQHNESVMTDRVTDYSVSAPAEFFAEAYATFYEEAGKPGVTDADHGRLIRNPTQRQWIRDNVHDRGHAPAGTGAAKAPEAGHKGGEDLGAHADGPKTGRKSGNSGL